MIVDVRKILETGIINYNSINDIAINENVEYILGIDASTTCTGLCLYNREKKAPEWTLAAKREDTEGKVRYKLKLKKLIETIITLHSNIKYSEHEEPFIQYADSASDLMALAPLVEEIKIENEPELDYLDHELVPNKRWKKGLLGDKLPSGSELEKKAITEELYKLYPQLYVLDAKGKVKHLTTQDERDATGICVAKDRELRGEIKQLKTVKVRPFKYEVEFVGGDDIDDALQFVSELKRIPLIVRNNGMVVTELKRGEKFDTKILNSIQNDDIICVIGFNADVAGNLYLKYKLSEYKKYEKVYAVVWRSNRKKAQK